MDKRTVYQIRLGGQIDRDWSAWFDDWQVEHTAEGETILTGAIKNQSALFGVLLKVRDLNLTLLAVNRLQAIDGRADLNFIADHQHGGICLFQARNQAG